MLPTVLGSVLSRFSRSRHDSTISSPRIKRQPCRSKLDRILAILSVLILIPAMVLSILCIYAGNTAGFMEPYAIFTLNVSRIGENLKDDLDHKIASINVSIKRSAPIEAPKAMITPPPTTFIKVRSPRNFDLDIPGTSKLGSLAHHEKSKAKSVASDASSEAHSAVSHATSAAASAIDSGLSAVQSEVIKLVNDAYEDIIDGLYLQAFYSLHMRTTCHGHYVTSDGKNITVGSDVIATNGTHKHVDKCEQHGALDPVTWIMYVYWAGFALTAIALLLALVNIFRGHLKYAILTICVDFLAFLIISLLTAVMHGLAFGAAKIVNFVGNEIGVSGSVNGWVQLSWTVAGLLFVDMVVVGVLSFVRHRKKKNQRPVISYRMEQMPNGAY